MNKFDVRRANAAVKATEAQIAGEYDYQNEISKLPCEKKFNNFRIDLYNKDIDAAKAAIMREVEILRTFK